MSKQHLITGIGEILWDILPGGNRLGGAPANFASHCRQLGNIAFPVASVGTDILGSQAIAELEEAGNSTQYIQRTSSYPTGRVFVSLDSQGKPCYSILEEVAWDHLEFTPELEALATKLDATCFGVLAQRSDKSRQTIREFLRSMPASSLKILDVNLRQPFFTKELVEESLQLATILKLSDEELVLIGKFFNLTGDVTTQLGALLSLFDLDLIAYTRGCQGSLLLSSQEISETTGISTTMVDSVGAGDSFTAALCTGILNGWSLGQTNKFANEVAAFVCSRQGATPLLPENLTREKAVS
ncbi:carbohydrate kinase family protein [Luteolibacter sp. AS25]|uniref:carbohydrate kinase family protein n=1 Tax=Luteolibacter sp. AS25 TaxID=3135776 RepID=UPI00398AD036